MKFGVSCWIKLVCVYGFEKYYNGLNKADISTCEIFIVYARIVRINAGVCPAMFFSYWNVGSCKMRCIKKKEKTSYSKVFCLSNLQFVIFA